MQSGEEIVAPVTSRRPLRHGRGIPATMPAMTQNLSGRRGRLRAHWEAHDISRHVVARLWVDARSDYLIA